MRAIDADAIEYTHAVARNLFDGYNWNELVVTKDEIEDMPTIQPEIVRCEECKYHHQKNCPIEKYFSLDGFCSRGKKREVTT